MQFIILAIFSIEVLASFIPIIFGILDNFRMVSKEISTPVLEGTLYNIIGVGKQLLQFVCNVQTIHHCYICYNME